MDGADCAFHSVSSLVFVGLAVFGGWRLERRRQREMMLTPSSRTPVPWRQIVLFVWFTLAATYTTEFALRWVNGCGGGATG
ncbi:MAG: hypothetical protein AAF677_00610 [Pseudomonadota bacterium]